MRRWLLPLAAAAVFFLVLLLVVPYATRYGSSKKPLGIMIWTLCMAGESSHATLDFSYCLFVPFIVAYLVYIRREQIARQSIRGSNAAMGLIMVGLLFYWFGLRAEMQVVGYASMQLLLAGTIVWLWGWDVFRKLLFPWAFFAFFWPLPFLDSTVALPLRMVMSHLAYDLLNLIGIHTIQSGTALVSAPNPAAGLKVGERFSIDIADPCSGIRSLLALLMMGALYGYLCLPKLWQQWSVFLAAIPVTIIANLARIVILVIGSITMGSAFAIGTFENPSWFHEGAGFAVYGVALGLELALGSLLTMQARRLKEEAGHASSQDDEPGLVSEATPR